MDTLHKIDPPPACTREFFSLAACHIRRELLDLTRRYHTARRHGAADSADGDGIDPPNRADDPDELDRWTRFHEAAERLPAEQREVVGLRFHHGWTEVQIGELFGVGERTVRRRWRSACLTLSAMLGEQVPEE